MSLSDVLTALQSLRDENKTAFESLKGDVKRMSNEIQQINTQLGLINERLLRPEVAKRYGEDYARPFLVDSAAGLARLLHPHHHRRQNSLGVF